MESDLAFVPKQFLGDFVIGGGQTLIASGFLAGFGVIGLNNRLHVNHISLIKSHRQHCSASSN